MYLGRSASAQRHLFSVGRIAASSAFGFQRRFFMILAHKLGIQALPIFGLQLVLPVYGCK